MCCCLGLFLLVWFFLMGEDLDFFLFFVWFGFFTFLMKSETLKDYPDLLDEVVTLLDGSTVTTLPIPPFSPSSSGALTLISSVLSFLVMSIKGSLVKWIESFLCIFAQYLHKTVVDASRCNYNQNNNIYICSFRFIGISLTMNLRYFPMQRCHYFFLYLSGITVYKSRNVGSQKSVSFHQNNTRRPKYKNSSGQELPLSVSV